MSSNPPITVIITAYRAVSYIELSLDSITMQNKPEGCPFIKIILAIDGCKMTLEKMKELYPKYKNIVDIYYSDDNHGTYMIINSVLISFKNKDSLVLFFASDDIMPQNFLKIYYDIFLQKSVNNPVSQSDIILRTRSINIKNCYLPDKVNINSHNISEDIMKLSKIQITDSIEFFKICISILLSDVNIKTSSSIIKAMHNQQNILEMRKGNYFNLCNYQYPQFPCGVFFISFFSLEKLGFFNTERVRQDLDLHQRARYLNMTNIEIEGSFEFIRRISDKSLVNSDEYGFNSIYRKNVIEIMKKRIADKIFVAEKKSVKLKKL